MSQPTDINGVLITIGDKVHYARPQSENQFGLWLVDPWNLSRHGIVTGIFSDESSPGYLPSGFSIQVTKPRTDGDEDEDWFSCDARSLEVTHLARYSRARQHSGGASV